jgi:hypothetical protein
MPAEASLVKFFVGGLGHALALDVSYYMAAKLLHGRQHRWMK